MCAFATRGMSFIPVTAAVLFWVLVISYLKCYDKSLTSLPALNLSGLQYILYSGG